MNILQNKIKESKLSNTEICYALGISEMTLYRKLNGQSEFRRSELFTLKHLLNISDEEFAQIKELRG